MKAATDLQPVIDGTLRAQVACQIVDMVTGGHFQPGQKLTETVLATQLGVSRAPLREAIRELIDKGIHQPPLQRALCPPHKPEGSARAVFNAHRS